MSRDTKKVNCTSGNNHLTVEQIVGVQLEWSDV
jgi:hypothetical protein